MTHRSEVRSKLRARGAAVVALWFACTLALGANSAAAETATALLQQVTGNPTIVELTDGSSRNVNYATVGHSYALPLEIETGARDAATLALPNSVIEVSPNTLMRVVAPEHNGSSLVQRILQQSGSSLFRVHRGAIDRFQVETPFLVSVVKGTVFNVLVQEDGTTVSLQEGRLQVDSLDARQTVELTPGDVAFAGRDGVLHLMQANVTDRSEVRRARAPANDASKSTGWNDAPRVAVDTLSNVVDGINAPMDTVSTSVVEPVVSSVVAPAVDTVVAPVVSTAVTPVVDTVATVAAPIASTVATVVAPVTTAVAPVAPVVASVAPAVTTVVAPAAPVVAPIVVPVMTPITTVPSNVTAPVAPVVAPLNGLLKH